MHARPLVAVAAVLGATLGGCAATGTGAEQLPPASPAASPAPNAAPDCPPASVEVASARQLQRALDDANPGDVIALADGTYSGRFRMAASGSAAEPIFVCGGAGAVLDGGGVDHGYVLHLDGVRHVRVVGFTVTNGQKGVMADGVRQTVIGGLDVHGIGDEAIHLRRDSTDNEVVANRISQTGQRRADFGEGVYVGTAESNWCDVNDCDPDASDRNRILGNTFSDTTAEAIDVKEGTTGGEIGDNTFDGAGLSSADSWVDVKGNDWVIRGNSGKTSPRDGFQTHRVADGWGTGNRFEANSAQLDGPGYGFALTPPLDNTVACDNVATDAGAGLSNVECSS